MGTQSKHDPVEALSVRKVDREGQVSDVIVDALLRITLDARLHRRGETQVECVTALLDSVQECRGEES